MDEFPDDEGDEKTLLCLPGSSSRAELEKDDQRVLCLPGIKSNDSMHKETSPAQYILQQYIAASGGQKLQNTIYNAYAMGKVRMLASDIERATKVIKSRNLTKTAESGGFVLWQMNPDMWYVELALGSFIIVVFVVYVIRSSSSVCVIKASTATHV